MKRYKVLKGISVVFALITLAAVFGVCFIELLNVDTVSETGWFVALCGFLKINPAEEDVKESILHYATLMLGVSYVFTFILWLITFKVGARTINQTRKEARQSLRSNGGEVKVINEKDLRQMRRAQHHDEKRAIKEAKRQEKNEAAKKEPEVVETVTTETVATTETSKAKSKYDDIINSLK